MNQASFAFVDLVARAGQADALAWQPFREGVEIHRLYGEGTEPAAALLRYKPGARVPTHAHTGLEHILVLSGSQSDENGHYPAGSLIVNPTGTRHTVVSEEGCVVLALWAAPVSFVF
jgi:anti-sigma factor ChrR (cupin superfamily)